MVVGSVTTPVDVTQKYQIGSTLGRGKFAVVKKCQDRTSGQHYAIKIIDKGRCEGQHDIIRNEMMVLKKLAHENIVGIIEESETDQAWFLIMEYMKCGDLFQFIEGLQEYTETNARWIIKDLLCALCYLHGMGVVHRDVKPENCLITTNEVRQGRIVKLSDFGLAAEVNEPLFTVCGTPAYVAPEVLNNSEKGYGTAVDVWSCGIIMYILLCGYPPFTSENKDSEEVFAKIKKSPVTYETQDWNSVSPGAKELIGRMLTKSAFERITADVALTYPWMSNPTDSTGSDASKLQSGAMLENTATHLNTINEN